MLVNHNSNAPNNGELVPPACFDITAENLFAEPGETSGLFRFEVSEAFLTANQLYHILLTKATVDSVMQHDFLDISGDASA